MNRLSHTLRAIVTVASTAVLLAGVVGVSTMAQASSAPRSVQANAKASQPAAPQASSQFSRADRNALYMPRFSAAEGTTCLILDSGSPICWGWDRSDVVSDVPDVSDAVQIDVSFGHACLVTRGGSVECWGENDLGQTNVPNSLGRVQHVATAWGGACVLLTTGSVKCWGTNEAGLRTPPNFGAEVVGLEGGDAMYCALLSDATVKCWGLQDRADRVDGARDVSDAVSLSSGRAASCAVLANERIDCWGFGDGRMDGFQNLRQVLQVSMGSSGCALTYPGEVECFGNWMDYSIPSAVTDVDAVAVGDDHACAILEAGTIRCWGSNGNNQLRVPSGITVSAGTYPVGVAAVVDGNSVSVSWDPMSDVDSYRVTVNPGALTCTSLVTSCSINGLEWGTDFTASVVAIGSTGTSAPSAAVSFSTEYRPDAPSRVTVQQSGTIAAVSWSAVTGADSYVVRVSPGNASCESVQRTCTVSGLTRGDRYAVQVFTVDSSIESEGSTAVSFIAGDTPGVVSGVGVVPGAGTGVVSWTPPVDPGDSVVTGYRVESAPGGLECVAVAPDTSCEVEGLTNGVPYLFEVFASNAVGEGEGVVSEETIAFTWPGVPGNVRAGVKSSTTAEVRWDAAAANGSAITEYVLHVSRDNGLTWSESSLGVVTKVNVPGLNGAAQAAWVKVSAVNAGGQSAFSEPVLVTTTGVKSSVRVSVVDSNLDAVIGGAITWEMVSGAAKSSKTYGLTDDGVIEFPLAPAGAVNVTVTGALTESGATVSGTFRGYLGFTSTVLQLPEAPVASRTVTVELPNGLPVPGVSVGLNADEGQFQDSDCLEWAIGDLSPEDYCLEGSYVDPSLAGGFAFSKTVQGFTFTVPRVAQILTDANGKVVLSGFTNGQPRVDVSYDDGIITQAKSVVLRNTDTVVQLDYMPWVEVSADSLAAGLGAAVTIPVSVETGDAEIASRSRLARANQGIKVTVLPPAGAGTGTCKAKLTAETNKAGKAALTVCATKSGMYRFKTEGAAAVDGVLLKVKGAAPMSPTAVTVRSLSVGTARASWNPPAYGGGSTITNYVITASAKGKPTVIKTVAGTVKSVSLTGLANATKYTVKIQAKTVKGLSDPHTVIVPVA
jgi:hypothetical protein